MMDGRPEMATPLLRVLFGPFEDVTYFHVPSF